MFDFMKLQDFFPGLLNFKKEEGMTQKTINEYKLIIETILMPSIGSLELEYLREIDTGKIKMAGREHGRFGPQRGIVVFRQLLFYIKKAGFVIPFDWRDIKVPPMPDKEVDWLTKEEWEAVRGAFNTNWIIGLRDRALVETLWATGMRIGEALSLNRDSIDFKNKEAIIKDKKKPYKNRKVYFTDESIYWIKQYLGMRNERFEALFVSITGQRALPCNIRRSLSLAVKKAGITKRVHPHLFRSTHATNLLEGGANIKAVQHLLGHESERTTLRHYAAVNKSHAKEEHQRILDKPVVEQVDFIKELMWKH